MESNLEIWKTSEDPNYEVSNFGNVRSIPRTVNSGPKTGNGKRFVKGGLVTPFVVKSTGYMQIGLSNQKRVFVHRLVAKAFCSGHFDGAVVNHKNGIRSDNRAANLEWVTHGENLQHGYRVLGAKNPFVNHYGKNHPTSKPIMVKCLKTGKEEIFDGGLEAKRKYPFFDSGSISRCCNGKMNSHKGFVFRFIEKGNSGEQRIEETSAVDA